MTQNVGNSLTLFMVDFHSIAIQKQGDPKVGRKCHPGSPGLGNVAPPPKAFEDPGLPDDIEPARGPDAVLQTPNQSPG